MPRPPLVHGPWGVVKATMITQGRWVAKARYRDVDGRTRLIERAGQTKQKAEDALRAAMRDRLKPISAEELGPDTRLSDLARAWWEEYIQGSRSNGTLRRYKTVPDRYVIGNLGGWMIREASVSKLDRFVKQTTRLNGYPNASIASVLLSGMCTPRCDRDESHEVRCARRRARPRSRDVLARRPSRTAGNSRPLGRIR